jgi:hypothetical protein
MAARTSSKELDALIREITDAGGEVVRSASGHYKVYVGPRLVASVAGTCSDKRAMRNARSNLRRAGLAVAR